MNWFRAYIARNSLPSRGEGGRLESLQLDDGSKVQVDLSGLDTEVIRATFWASYDAGTTWEFAGHIGTTGGDVFSGPTGDLVLDTTYSTRLREPENRFRLFRVVLECGERLQAKCTVEFDTVLDLNKIKDDHHSIAVDDAQQATGGSGTSVSTPNVTPAGSNRYLAAFAGNDKYPSDSNITSLSFGATGMTSKFTNDGGVFKNNGYELVAPSTTPSAVTVVWAASPSISFVGGVAFSGVAQTGSSDASPAASTGSSTAPSQTITAGETGDVRVALISCGLNSNPALTVGANEISRVNGTVGGSPYVGGFMVETKEDNGSDAMNATIATSTNWYIRGWNINMAGGGGATAAPNYLTLLGVGA